MTQQPPLFNEPRPHAEAEKTRAAAAEHAAKAEARAEVQRLERELAAARAKLTGNLVSSTAIRAWAKANNVTCAGVGRVPKDVRAAYDAAHREAS